MQGLLSQFAADPIPYAIGAVVAVFLLMGAWKLLKGLAKVVLIVALLAAIAGILFWMSQGGPLP